MNDVEFTNDAQADLVFETIQELYTLLRLKECFLRYKYMGDDIIGATQAFDRIRSAIAEARFAIFGLCMIPGDASILARKEMIDE